jgi:hypothetical protein
LITVDKKLVFDLYAIESGDVRIPDKDWEERVTEMMRIANIAVAKAQEESRRLGVPNVYRILGKIYYECPDGTLSLEDPYVEPNGSTGKSSEQPHHNGS